MEVNSKIFQILNRVFQSMVTMETLAKTADFQEYQTTQNLTCGSFKSAAYRGAGTPIESPSKQVGVNIQHINTIH